MVGGDGQKVNVNHLSASFYLVRSVTLRFVLVSIQEQSICSVRIFNQAIYSDKQRRSYAVAGRVGLSGGQAGNGWSDNTSKKIEGTTHGRCMRCIACRCIRHVLLRLVRRKQGPRVFTSAPFSLHIKILSTPSCFISEGSKAFRIKIMQRSAAYIQF